MISLFPVTAKKEQKAPPFFEWVEVNKDRIKEEIDREINLLDKYQREVVTAPMDCHLRVKANAGSGKTRALIMRVLWAFHTGWDPSRMLLCTFTSKSAKEMQDRYFQFFSRFFEEVDMDWLINWAASPRISTIHSFGARLLRDSFGFRYSLLSEYQSAKLMKSVLSDLVPGEWALKDGYRLSKTLASIFSDGLGFVFGVPVFDIERHPARYLDWDAEVKCPQLIQRSRVLIDSRVCCGDPSEIWETYVDRYEVSSKLRWSQLERVARKYLVTKYQQNTIDFADMVWLPQVLMSQHLRIAERIRSSFDFIYQDEAQDQDTSQFGLLVMCDKHAHSQFMEGSEYVLA